MSSNADPSALVDFIAGTVGGAASLLAGHPFDTIKTRLQSQSIAPTAGSSSNITGAPIYKNAMDTFRVIVKEEKFVGLYKGVTSPLLGVAIMNASVFGCYSLALRAQLGSDRSIDSASLGQIMLAGMASGVMTALITAPIDLLKIRQQNDTRVSTSASTLSIVRDIVRRHGITGLFRGYGATCVRDLGYGPYFFTYELLNRGLLSLHTSPILSTLSSTHEGSPGPLPSTPPRLSALELAISGGIAGMVGWAVTFWADTIKTRIQATERVNTAASAHSSGTIAGGSSDRAALTSAAGSVSSASRRVGTETDRLLPRTSSTVAVSSQSSARLSTSASARGTRSVLDWITERNEFIRVARDIYARGGYRAFWIGIGPTMLRAIPTNAVLFIVYESTKSACIDWGI